MVIGLKERQRMRESMAEPEAAVEVSALSYSYATRLGERQALKSVSFSVKRGEIFGLLGPNGGGKTTLFRILSTYFPPASGSVRIFGEDAAASTGSVRRKIGVVFQHPSLDKKLTVLENLEHQGHLYGLSGGALKGRIAALLKRFGLEDRAGDLVESLSGGLQRRAELAKGLLHSPEVLILDEPSTGLDPGARKDLWSTLRELCSQDATTALLTTHLMEEAERCDRLGILNRGELVALGTPDELKSEVGSEVLSITAAEPQDLAGKIRQAFGLEAKVVDGTIRVERAQKTRILTEILDRFGGAIESATLAKPTLEDVFIHRTGHKFWREEA